MSKPTKFETKLREAFPKLPSESIDLALRLIRGKADPLDTEAGQRRKAECYNDPGHHDLLMHALNALLETHGVEYVGEVDMHTGPPVEYLNTGDSYAWTLVWYRDSEKFRVEGYCDAIERLGL